VSKAQPNQPRHHLTLKLKADKNPRPGFNTSLEQPSPTNPLGNPAYPGWTSANGPNWVDFLTVKYNASTLLTYNLAYGGATVDSALVKPYLPTVLSLKDQVQTLFLPTYGAAKSPAWTGKDTLFALWLGINDVGNSFNDASANVTTLYRQIFDEYARQVEALRAAGARNFLFLNVPPVDRSPLTLGQGQDVQAKEREAVALFNAWVAVLAGALKGGTTGEEANVWVYDVHTDFTDVLDLPKRYKATEGYVNIDEYCDAYQK
jgi:phospholipase/lecithinase/hemolysin